MGFLSNALGGGTSTSTSSTSTGLPDWFSNYGQNLFASATNNFLNAPYPGSIPAIDRVAGTNADLDASAASVRNMQGSSQPYLNSAGALTRAAGNPALDQNVFSSYMNPYTSAVTDRIAQLGQRNLTEKLLPSINANFITSGNFGSSQNQDFVQRALRDTNESILGQQAQALESGYNTSLGAYNAAQQRQLGAGAQLGQLGQLQQSTDLRDAAALEEVGKNEQNTQQKYLDVNNANFLEGRDWGRNMTAGAGAVGAGYTPPATTTTDTTSTSPSGGNLGSLLGGAAVLGSTLPWNAISSGIGSAASAIGSIFGFKRGGRVPGALRRYASGGMVAPGTPLSFAPPRLPPAVSRSSRPSVGALRRVA
jgi:hypothetical protein